MALLGKSLSVAETEPWVLDEGLALIRAIQTDTRNYGYHIALGGGVLNKGRSSKDIDLFFLPMEGKGFTMLDKKLVAWLISMWGEPEDMTKPSKEGPKYKTVRSQPVLRTSPWSLNIDNIVATNAPPPPAPVAPNNLGDGLTEAQREYARYQEHARQIRDENNRIEAERRARQAENLIPEQPLHQYYVANYNADGTMDFRVNPVFAETVAEGPAPDPIPGTIGAEMQAASAGLGVITEASVEPYKSGSSIYRYKLKFHRGDGRIDAFIV
jgi:hypothetical protein